MDWELYAIAVIGSALAGAINTLAGNGSAITLTILTELMGLPGNLANGTNRIGIFTQSTAGVYAFHRNGKLDVGRSWIYIGLTSIGAVAGIIFAIRVSNEQFMSVFKVLMVLMLVVILVKPSRWLRETDADRRPNLRIAVPLFLAIGFYGGFIQMGMGVFFLAAMVLGARYGMIEANAVKIVVVGLYTLLAIIIFAYKGLIDWKIGLLFAVGQTAGGYLTAHYASRYPQANVWAYRILIVVVILAILRLFDFSAIFRHLFG